MPTSKEIANLGLGKIGASRVSSLAPAVSPIERIIADGYTQWKREEIAKRRWVCATKKVVLTPAETITDTLEDGRVYRYDLPGDFIVAVRNNKSTWIQRGQSLYSADATMTFEYRYEVPDAELTDVLLINVLACRIAVECAEPATQSPGKKREAVILHKDALDEAGRQNAFQLDDDNPVNDDDEGFSWVVERLYPNA